ncbi:MAG: acetyl-CoA hydrolase/transferase C-terminal domain-containing protein [Clostridium sp.]|nr:acetyl-CoA hydrolase/transferase C-terminal domain-containing protein [Clostridium sp.]
MKVYSEYKKKLRKPEEAVMAVKDGDWVDYSVALGYPELLDYALAARRDELKDIKVRGCLELKPVQVVENDREQRTFTYSSWHVAGPARKYCDESLCYYIPMIFRNLGSYYTRYLPVNVAMMCVCPMDEEGYFNFSYTNCYSKAVLDKADIVILEVNERLPNVYGEKDYKIHISEVDYVVEGEHPPLAGFAPTKVTDIDRKIASLIVEEMKSGDVVQLGIGGMPNAVAAVIANSEIRNLSMHTELLSDGYLDLNRAGKLTNVGQKIHGGKGVFGIAIGSQDMYDWVKENDDIRSYPMAYVNSPEVMSKIDNLISINNCISVDLYGQVASETSGIRHISGTGGQLDFTTGAYMSPGGKGFICLTSTFKDKKGQVHSRILPRFIEGDIITTPRTQTFNLVTEYGKVNLAGRSTWERAEMIISIAHPDFREELIDAAKKQRIWRNSNKR